MSFSFGSVFSAISKFGNQHKPAIYTGTGIAFMLAGTAFAINSTAKTMKASADIKDEKLRKMAPDQDAFDELTAEEVQRYEEIQNSPVSAKEVLSRTWPSWMRALIFESTGIIFLLLAQKENESRLAAMTSALAYHIAEKNDYMESAKEVFGKKEEEIEKNVIQKKAAKAMASDSEIVESGHGNDLLVDYYTGQRLHGSVEWLRSMVNELNNDINHAARQSGTLIGLNDWLYKIGLEPSPLANNLAWNTTGGNQRGYQYTELAELDEQWVPLEGPPYKMFIIKFKKGHAPVYQDDMYV